MSTLSSKTIDLLEQFNNDGFIRIDAKNQNNKYVKEVLRFDNNVRIFKAEGGKKSSGKSKYGTYDFFGVHKFVCLYDKEKIGLFIDFLNKLFSERNPDADGGMKRAFKYLLLNNYVKDTNKKEKYCRKCDNRMTIENGRKICDSCKDEEDWKYPTRFSERLK